MKTVLVPLGPAGTLAPPERQRLKWVSRTTVTCFAIFLLLACVAAPAQAQPVAGLAPADRSLAQAQPWRVAAQDMHSRRWESILVITNPLSGQVEQRRAQIAELSSGMNYRDEQGQWQPTREEFQIQPDGSAVAAAGPHKVTIARNLNADTAVDMTTSDGVRLRSGPLAVGYYDPVDGANVILATIRDCSGRLAAPNVIIFDNAFDGIKASIRITYRKAGISQDLLLHEAPPPPEKFGLSERSRLELYTEFRPETPTPRQTVVMLRAESDPQVRQAMVEPDLTDRLIDFGAYKMGTGLAFEGEGKAGTQKLPVMKRYETIDGRPVLIEAVEYQSAKDLLSMLPPGPAAPRQARAQVRRSPMGAQRPLLARALRSKPAPVGDVKPIQEARLRKV